MSSSSSSGYSDEDAVASVSSDGTPTLPSDLSGVVELAQICSFCSTFRQSLRLPSFSRTELQAAILGATNGDMIHVELLAELHYKLSREHPSAKMEKMVQDWEKTLARKISENWRRDFSVNPMRVGAAYRDLTVHERVKILDALCHWKLESCGEVHKHIATLQKENDNDAIKKLRQGEIGTDDNGVSYLYFDDGCWIYAEGKPQWMLEERKPSYLVEFANAKRIRLSINFDPDLDTSALPVQMTTGSKHVSVTDEVEVHKKEKTDKVLQGRETQHVSVLNVTVETASLKPVKLEKEAVIASATTVQEKNTGAFAHGVLEDVKQEVLAPVILESATTRKMDISVLCASVSPSSEDRMSKPNPAANSHIPNGSARDQHIGNPDKTNVKTKVTHTSPTMTKDIKSPQENGVAATVKIRKENMGVNAEDTYSKDPEKGAPAEVHEDNSAEHSHTSVVTVGGAKKRTIIDDDSSDSTCNSDTPEGHPDKKVKSLASSSPPPRKKRKSSSENVASETETNTKANKSGAPKSDSVQANDTAELPETKVEFALKDEKMDVFSGERVDKSTVKKDDEKDAAVMTTEAESAVKISGPPSTSPTDPTVPTESFDITCESCKKCYDMRYLDPPLVERPNDEWRCFECLVNDARGWPRRRKITPREPFSPRSGSRGDNAAAKKRSSSSKKRSSSSSSKKSKRSSSKTRSSSSSKKKSHSGSSKRKSSSSKSSSSKKSSSSSSSKKHKKRKSSSSSSHHSSHHRRRHHSHYHHEDFAKLFRLFRERQQQRAGIEEGRMSGELPVTYDDAPHGWRVVSSTLDDLQSLIQTLSGGSLEQDRLRGRLIVIQKAQEKLEEQRRKQQELAWNILPRRQSSRIAIERLKTQTAKDSDAEDVDSDGNETGRPCLRSSRPRSATSNGYDGKQKLAHDRARRARRRHGISDDDMDDDEEDDEEDTGVPGAGNWIDWSIVKGSTRCLSTVCLALINRLLKEEASELFARPVDPELDGCPNYLSVIAQPMDLGTIRSRLGSSFYQKWEVFKKDVDLVWQNCRTFNPPDTMVVQFANLLAKLFRTMCATAEKKGVERMTDKGGDGGNDSDEEDAAMSSSAESKTGSVNKAWTESSAPESSESSGGGTSSSDGESDSEAGGSKRRSSRNASKKLQTRTRSRRSGRSGNPAKTRTSRRRQSSTSKKRAAPASSSEDETSDSEEGEVFSPVQTSRRQQRKPVSKPAAMKKGSSGDDAVKLAEDLPPPPPPPQPAQKRSKPRLVVSDSSSSEDNSDSGNSSSSSSSSSSDSDSDASPTSAVAKRSQAPPPSSEDGSIPPPPPPPTPPPAAPPVATKPQVRASPSSTKRKTAADHGRKAKTPTKKTPPGVKVDIPSGSDAVAAGYANSPSLLNSYLSSFSSSSSDFSSGDSESSDGANSDDSD